MTLDRYWFEQGLADAGPQREAEGLPRYDDDPARIAAVATLLRSSVASGSESSLTANHQDAGLLGASTTGAATSPKESARDPHATRTSRGTSVPSTSTSPKTTAPASHARAVEEPGRLTTREAG